MIFRKNTNQVDIIETTGAWIGLIDDIKGMLEDDELALNPGDTMLLFTDGITESWKKGSDRRDMFGDEQLKNIFCGLGNCSTEEIKNGILNSLEDYDSDDDITMLILKRV